MGEKQGQPNNARLIEPNEHGVYQPAETLALPNPRPGWKGGPLAEIDLIELPDGWRSAIGAMLASSGRGEPLTARPPAYASREEAIQGGIDKLRRWLATSNEAQAPVVGRWLDTLIPDQPDLFGAAA